MKFEQKIYTLDTGTVTAVQASTLRIYLASLINEGAFILKLV
jgi:hypothetical protein